MNAKKKREKNRRRARRLADQAWEAADNNNLDLALKMIHRAVNASPGNPVLWNDQGLLLRQHGDLNRAAAAFEAAISLAVDYAEAYANLSDIRSRQGQAGIALQLQIEAVKHAPAIKEYQDRLVALRAIAGTSDETINADHSRTDVVAERTAQWLRLDCPDVAERIDNLDWTGIEDRLTKRGYAHVRRLIAVDRCEQLRSMFDEETLFAKTIVMNKPQFGNGVYRYYRSPVPPLVDSIRQCAYPHVARIANEWQCYLNRSNRYPEDWMSFSRFCAENGQTTSTPLLLKYETDGFNALHQDIRGAIFFPIQLVVVLSNRVEEVSNDSREFAGGEFLLCDQPEHKNSDRHQIAAGLGDAVLFCTRERLVKIGGAYGLKSVKHGMDRVKSGIRYALGIPFHEND